MARIIPHSDNGYYGSMIVRPKLRESMSKGYLLVNYQGHAIRTS